MLTTSSPKLDLWQDLQYMTAWKQAKSEKSCYSVSVVEEEHTNKAPSWILA